MQIMAIAILVALKIDTVVPIEKNGTKRSMKISAISYYLGANHQEIKNGSLHFSRSYQFFIRGVDH